MKALLAAGAAAGLLLFTLLAWGAPEAAPARGEARAARSDWNLWSEWAAATHRSPTAAQPAPTPAAAEIDVVDAHWMALTMWGEARGQGEEGMRAVGHVIDNRRRAGLATAFVTDTVREAFQFSCWNPGDPNRSAMMNIDALRPGSGDHERWLIARRVADEIMAGRSADPTGGALFYHTVEVSPRWSRGVVPVRRIGTHLFFRTARAAA